MGRRILAIAAAAVIALIGAVLVLLYARGADNRAVAAASPTAVYVTNTDVPAGTSLKEAMRLQEITQTQVPARSLPAGALTTVDDSNSALVALTDIAPGQYVLAAGFGETPTGQAALQVFAHQTTVDKPFIIQDTDLFSTVGYYELWDGKSPDGIISDAQASKSDIYLITPSNIPFEVDPIRYGGDKRESDDQFWIDLAKREGLNYHVLKSATRNGRRMEAIEIVGEHFDAHANIAYEREGQ